MKIKAILLILFALVAHSQMLVEVDLKNHYSKEGYFITVPSGFILDLEQIQPYLADSSFRGYLQNSNLMGDWSNNFHVSISLPKGYIYDCDIYSSATQITCKSDLSLNDTFWEEFGDFIYQTCLQPFWSMGFSNEFYDFNDYTFQSAFYYYIMTIYYSTFSTFQLNVVQQGDKMVENGYRSGTYTVQDFLAEAYMWELIAYGVIYIAPGITDNSDYEWIANWPTYRQNVWISYFSIECVVFQNPADLTIENMMLDTYTKQYINNRKKTSDTTSLSQEDMANQLFSISKLQLVEGDGIDGVTNTFAATIWLVDFIIEALISKFVFVDVANTGAYQRVLGEPSGFKPTPLYYALIFISLARDGDPEFLIPKTEYGESGSIKVFGLETSINMKLLIINKDTNSSIDGYVRVKASSSAQQKLKCTYLEAPSLSSKVEDITIGGYQYVQNDHNPQGNYKQATFSYNQQQQAYDVEIKYAQMAVCQFRKRNTQIPTGSCDDEDDEDEEVGSFWEWFS